MSARRVEMELPWTADSGRQYLIPLCATITRNEYGTDYDGRRGELRWEFEDFELNGLEESELSTIITDPDDLEGFSLDLLSEDAFDYALDII
jgi:hypothetical protein